MSKTPRTDEYAGISEDFRGVEVVPADISRELEKRLAEAQAELADKEKQLAEITRQRNAYKKALEMAEDELMTVRAEIESLKLSAGELNGAFNARPKCEKCKDKDKLIEQMREALRLALPEARSTHCEQTILAALAAERGEL